MDLCLRNVKLFLCISLVFFLLGYSADKESNQNLLPYKNYSLSLDERVEDLLSRMTLEEKVSQMMNDAPAVERLDIPRYNWWNECLHGVARAGLATVFPQAIGLAATWDAELMYRMAIAISDEARAKHHEFIRRGKRGIYQGLTFWSPNINIFRDPRWGRGMETYGEDPFLTGRMAVSFVRGLQGEDPRYLKVIATPKHYAVHSGPESDRHTFDARTDVRDLKETYLPHFEMAIKEAHAFSVMCAYNRYEGEACCGSQKLLAKILREEWGFEGYVVSDCGAIQDIHQYHKVVETPEEASALAAKSGCDLNCGSAYKNLSDAVKKGFVSEEEIDASLRRLLKARFKLGMFDPPEMVPYSQIPYSKVDCEEHQKLALEAARASVVLLKNEDDLLPLRKDIGSIAVIGPNAHDVEVEGFAGGDRLNLELPATQIKLMKAMHSLGKPIVLVLLNGSALAVNWAHQHIPAILEAWYPGQAAGEAIADVLFGDYNPAGRLPVTFYKSVDQLPPFKDYSMEGRTYRYFKGEPLYPFGYGLSYTKFKYTGLMVPQTIRGDQDVLVSVDVENVGKREGDEVVELYLTDFEATVPVPVRSLKGFWRVRLKPGEKKTVRFTLKPRDLSLIDSEFKRVVEPGIFEVAVGGKQPGFKGHADAPITEVLTARFEVLGKIISIK